MVPLHLVVFYCFLIFLVVTPTLCVTTDPTPRNRISTLICSNITVSQSSKPTFIKNYIAAINSVRDTIKVHGFGEHAEGIGSAAPVYAFGQCMKDLTAKDCALCFESLVLNMDSCDAIGNGTRAGRLYMAGCYLHYDYHDFHKEIITMEDRIVCGVESESSLDFPNAVEWLLLNLTHMAPTNGGFAVASARRKEVSAFGLA